MLVRCWRGHTPGGELPLIGRSACCEASCHSRARPWDTIGRLIPHARYQREGSPEPCQDHSPKPPPGRVLGRGNGERMTVLAWRTSVEGALK